MTRDQLVTAAHRAVERGDAQAVILFGSRVRGTAHDQSDWDICLIADGEHLEHAKALAGHDPIWANGEIDTFWINHEELRRNAYEGTVCADIVREGEMLDGDPEMLRNIEIKPFKAEDVVRQIARANRRLRAAVGHASARAVESDQFTREELAEDASLATIDAAEAIGRAVCALADVQHSGTHDLAGNSRKVLDKAKETTDAVDRETLAQMGTCLKMMNGGLKAPRKAPYLNIVESEENWTRRLIWALRAEEALRSGLVEGTGRFERLGLHERAPELAPALRERTERTVRDVHQLHNDMPQTLNADLRAAITNWHNAYAHIAGTGSE